MPFIDTHSHINHEHFKSDVHDAIKNAIASGVNKIVIANVDSSSVESMLKLKETYPDIIYTMMGVHPTSINENFEKELDGAYNLLEKHKFVAIGEIGIDLYWETKYLQQQKEAFKIQYQWAKDYNLPINIHIRNAFDELFETLLEIGDDNIFGIMHCFSGNLQQAQKCIDYGLKLGIGGVVTFKNGGLHEVVKNIDLQHIVLETDSPWLAPTPHRGKENQPAYIKLIAQKIADLKNISIEQVEEVTTANAKFIYKI